MVWPRAELGTRRIRMASVRTQSKRRAGGAGGTQECPGVDPRLKRRESAVASELAAEGEVTENAAG
jgi:hypothetical protein